MSSVDIWKNAPSTIRNGSTVAPSNTSLATSQQDLNIHKPPTYDLSQNRTPLRQGYSNPDNPHPTEPQPPPSNSRGQIPAHPPNRPHDDNTIATFTSTASTTLNSSFHAHRFAELDAAIKAHQHDFQLMNERHQAMENKIIDTMTSCHENTKQLLTMQGHMNSLHQTMQSIAKQMKFLTEHLTAPKPGDPMVDNPTASPAKKKQRHAAGLEAPIITQTQHTDFRAQESNPGDPKNANQEVAQYTSPRSPGTAMEE
jgi:hypothetical protein